MSRARQYRLTFPDPDQRIVVTGTGAMGREGTEVFTDETGGVRVEIDAEGRIVNYRTALATGGPSGAEPLD